MTASFDHIVVGAGSSGAALAGRLSDAGARVLVLEAGGPPRGPYFRIPAALMKLWFDPKVTWSYATQPEPGLNGRSLPAPRGRVLGGSSAINGMVCNRGSAWDYDQWAALGLDGWSFAEVLPYFRRLEANWRGESALHGADGPVPVSAFPGTANTPLVAEAARGMGFDLTEDFAGPRPEGFGVPDVSTRRGRRVTSADAYMGGHRPTLTIATGARVLRVLVEGRRAVGVEYLQEGQVRTARTDGEVILCGGVFNSPQLLMLSGLGPADELNRHGIAPLLDLPGVGRDLEDQPAARFMMAAREPLSLTRELRFDRFAASALRWLVKGDGFLAGPPAMGFFIVRTQPGLPAPDMRMIVSPPMDSRIWFPGVRAPAAPGVSVGFSLCYPRSRGAVTLASADPLAAPRIQLNIYDDPHDLAEMRRGYRLMRDLLRQPALSPYLQQMVMPPAEPHADDEIDAYLRAATATTFHPVGSCRMGTGSGAVVDAAMRVRGVEGLRVVDTSIFPTQIGGNPHLPAVMLAEKAADLILGRPAPAPVELPR